MLKQFELNISKNTLFSKTDKLLVAFSGGVDSVVLTDLLYKAGYNIELAHCNFQLRGQEAKDDTKFCENYAKSINAPFHIIYFDTKTYAAQQKLSIQMAARELRYNWFNELKTKHHFDYILTAHHANDNAETLFVNLIRGTGIKGLQGIPEKQNDMIRPLLFAKKDEIIHYAKINNLTFREDSSNQEIKYKRNFIRHEIIPQLKTLNPSIEETLSQSIQFFKQASDIITDFANQKFKMICIEKDSVLSIDIALLLNEPQKEILLHEWLFEKGFKVSQLHQLIECLKDKQATGKFFQTKTHQLVIDRKYILIKPFFKNNALDEFIINTISDVNHLPFKLTFNLNTTLNFENKPNAIVIEYHDKLFPLTLRKWRSGDKFQPLGMTGRKKLSDYFKDQKLSKFEKESVWLLESNHEIIWVIGYRMSETFKLKKSSEQSLRISVSEINS